MAKEILTTKEVAEYLSIHEKQVYRLIKEKSIPAIHVSNRRWLFEKNLVQNWIVSNAIKHVSN